MKSTGKNKVVKKAVVATQPKQENTLLSNVTPGMVVDVLHSIGVTDKKVIESITEMVKYDEDGRSYLDVRPISTWPCWIKKRIKFRAARHLHPFGAVTYEQRVRRAA